MPPADPFLLFPEVSSMPTPVVVPPLAESVPPPVETIGVLHLINGEHYAGAERVQDLLALRLPEFGFRAGFACLKLDAFDTLRESRASELFDLSMRGRFDPRPALRLRRIIRRGGYRLIHAHTVRSTLVGSLSAAWSGVPLVVHVHSPAALDSTRRRFDRFNAAVLRRCLRRASRVIAVSQALAEHVAADGFPAERIKVVHNGVPGMAELPKRQRPWGCWTLGIAALFRPRKGLEVLLEAMSLLHQRGIPVRLRAIGAFESPRYEAEIAAHVRRLRLNDWIAWRGFCRHVPDELQQLDLLVLPSLFGEGLPMVVLEAMAAGVPVVAADVPGIFEAVRDGREGVLFTPGDAERLADAVAAIIDGRYDWMKLRRNAFRRHGRLFSDRRMAAEVAAVYREVLCENR
jgi:glycosyltransferase involved in cell wall biosynthesis